MKPLVREASIRYHHRMSLLISEKQQEALKDLGVQLVVMFGSQALGRARPGSDVDIGVLFDYSIVAKPRRYGEVYALLQSAVGDARLDLIVLNDAAYTVQYKAALEGKPLFEATHSSYADFRESAMIHYFDFQPLLRIHSQALGMPNV